MDTQIQPECIKSEPIIAHSVSSWLPLTQNWIYNQIKWQERYKTIILAGRYTSAYPEHENLYVSDALPNVRRLVNKIIKKITARDLYFDNILARYTPIVLFSHFGPVGWEDSHLKNKKCHITRFYGYDINKLPNVQPIWKQRFRNLFDGGDAFITEGPYMRASLIQRGCPAEKVFIHRLGTDVEHIPFRPRIIDGRLKILMASRFVEKKGLLFAIEGIAKAYHDLSCKEISVTIIGDSNGAPAEEQYKSLLIQAIKSHNIGHIFQFAGELPYDDMLRIALDHNIFLHPSVTASDGDCEGGYPIALLDMMASGLPVVSTNHCDIPQVVPDNRFGILCAERNSDDIAQALYRIINRKVVFDSAIISEYIRREFSWEKSGRNLTTLIENVLMHHQHI